MSFRPTDPESVRRAVEALAAGASVPVAAKVAGISVSTLQRWMGVGPPCDVPGVAPKDVPLIFSAIRLKNGVSVNEPLNDGEALVALKLAAKEVIKAVDEFRRAFGGEAAR